MNARLTTLIAVAAIAGSLLAACGGGGGGGGDEVTPPPTEDPTVVPASAMASPQAMVTFLKAQAQSEDGEPMRMNGIDPPASDTDEPLLAA
jgi:hypothetical protein